MKAFSPCRRRRGARCTPAGVLARARDSRQHTTVNPFLCGRLDTEFLTLTRITRAMALTRSDKEVADWVLSNLQRRVVKVVKLSSGSWATSSELLLGTPTPLLVCVPRRAITSSCNLQQH